MPKRSSWWCDLRRKEELATKAANIAFDALFLGDTSAWNQSIEAYQRQGKTETEAFWATMKDSAVQTALAGATGAVIGAMFGASSTPGMYTRSRSTEEVSGSYDTTQEAAENRQYGIDVDPDTGQQYVQADRQVVKGNDPARWGFQVESYINERIRKGEDVVLPTVEGDAVTLTATTAWKLKDRHKAKIGKKDAFLTADQYRIKETAAAHVDELIQVSKYEDSKESKNSRIGKIGKDGFDYRTVLFRDFDGNFYTVTISVGVDGIKKTAYNLGKIKRKTFDMPLGTQKSADAPTRIDTSEHPIRMNQKPFDSSIPQMRTNVNRTSEQLLADVEAQRAAGGGVVSDGIPAWMTSREKRALNAVAQSQQLVVRFASEGELSGGTLGYLDGDTIVLNPESKQPVLDTYIHEVTHALKQTAPESYRQYQQGILDILGDETLNSRTQIAVEKLRERYEAVLGEVSESQLNDELTAEFTSWVLQTNVQAIENLAGIHRNVFQRVYDALSEVWQRIRLGTSGGEAATSLKNILGLDLDDVDVERIESTLEALRDVFGESEANVRAVGRSHEAGVPSYHLAEQSEILSNESSEKGFTNGVSRGTINTESAEGEIGVDTELLKSPEWSAPETGYKYRKPPHSPDINKLLKRKGSVKIEPVNNVWTFTMVVGGEQVTVVYKNGEPDFTPYVKAKVKVECTGNRGVDARRADEALRKTENRQPPRGCVRHHTADGMTIQWVPKEIHEKFSHEGFVVKMKRLKKRNDYRDDKK